LEADLGQKEAELEKTQVELETASESQLSHMQRLVSARSWVMMRESCQGHP
jgi:hypothetical protein